MSLRALQGPTGGGTPVGGTGTTNTIPRWTGASTLGDSGFVDDGSTIAAASRMLAIGTSSTTGARVWIQNNSSGNTLVIVSPSGAGSAFGQLIEAGTNASDYALNIRQRGTSNPLVYVRGDGNVGIGTASPASRLHVNDTSTTSTTRNIYTGTITAGLGGSIGLGGYWNGTTETVFAYIVGGKDNATSGDYGGHLQFWTRPNGGVYTERARIDSAGNLTLNTANTGATIQAAGLQQGIKLAPASAASFNTDPNTLDCYQENTWTPTLSAAATWGGTQPTVTSARYTRIGRMVFCEVKLDLVAGFSVIYGSTTITGPFNAGAETAVPVSYGATGQIGAQASGSTTVYLPTVASTQLARITWSFSI